MESEIARKLQRNHRKCAGKAEMRISGTEGQITGKEWRCGSSELNGELEILAWEKEMW